VFLVYSHCVVGSKADMLNGFVDLLNRPIECRAHAVRLIATSLCKTDGWFGLFDMG